MNRIWYHLMGRGLVDPVDDFRATNPASHPALLDKLADDFVAHHYDVRYLIRLIRSLFGEDVPLHAVGENAIEEAEVRV